MTVEVDDPAISIASARQVSLRPVLEWLARRAEPVAITLVGILAGLALFSSLSWRSANRRPCSTS